MAGVLDFMLPASDPNDPNKSVMTADQIARRQQMADALMKQGSDYSPVQSPWQGLARMANAALGGYMNHKGETEARDANKSNSDALASALLGMKGGSTPSMAPAMAPGGGGVSMPASGGSVPAGPLTDAIQAASAKNGVDPAYLTRTAQLESSYGKNLQSPLSSAGGPFAFTNGTARQYGLSDKNDPAASADAAARLALDNRQALAKALGRDPSNPELYLAHQQGAGGAGALLSNPQANVVDALTPVYGGNRAAAMTAVRNNGGSPDMTAGQFAGKWTGKFGQPAVQTVPGSQMAGVGMAPSNGMVSPDAAAAIGQAAPMAQQPSMAYAPGQVKASPLPAPGPAAEPQLSPEMLQAYAQRQGMAPAPAPDAAGGATLGAGPVNPDAPAPGATNAGPAPAPVAPPGRDTGNGSYDDPFLEGSPQAMQAQQAGQGKAQDAQKSLQMQQLMGVIQNPYTTPAQRQIATMVMQKYMTPDNVSYQTTPDGTILQMDPKGQKPPTPVYQAPVKKQYGVIGKDQFGTEQYGWIDPVAGSVSPNAPAAAPAPAAGSPAAPADGLPPAPAGVNPKIWRDEATKKAADQAVSGGPKMTEGQANANLYATRMEASEKILRETEAKEGTSTTNKILDYVPGGNMLRGEGAQRFDQAKRDFVNAVLRRESGAAISSSEFSNAEKQYFAQPGDGPKVIEQKRDNRKLAIDGIKAASGKAAPKPDATPKRYTYDSSGNLVAQ